MRKNIIWPLAILACLFGVNSLAQKRNGGSQPNAPIPLTEVRKLTGDYKDAKLDRDINILWLYGPEDHRGGEHDYVRIKELFVPMLNSIPRITVDEAYQFPTQAQFDKADLLIQYLHLPDLTDEQFAMYQKFVDNGGGVVSIHESCIMRPPERAEKLAGCIGCSWKGNQSSRWSKFNHAHPIYLNTDHAAFKGLPGSIKLNDESYWNLLKKDNVEVIAAIAPADTKDFAAALKHPEVRSDAFWTYTSGKGRVFGTTTGHYTYTYYDPTYRVLLLRGMAWALNIDPDPLMPIATQDITDDRGFVGTKDSMMDYKNRKR